MERRLKIGAARDEGLRLFPLKFLDDTLFFCNPIRALVFFFHRQRRKFVSPHRDLQVTQRPVSEISMFAISRANKFLSGWASFANTRPIALAAIYIFVPLS
jgi:hypothetical protein